MKLLNAGCGTHYAEGWVNTDVWSSKTTRPDVVVKSGEPYPFEDDTFDAAFLGHVIEHMPWAHVPVFIDDISRVVKDGAPILIVGPDVLKTIKRWKDGHEPWHMVLSTMEHLNGNHQPDREEEWWDGAPHHWNCHEERVVDLLDKMGFRNVVNLFDEIPNDTSGTSWYDEASGITWPVVGKYHWQFAVKFLNVKTR